MSPEPTGAELRSGAMTGLGVHAAQVAALPADPRALAVIVQGLVLHMHWAESYGVTPTEAQRHEAHLRPVERMLDRLLERDPSPLVVARPPERRLIGVCRDFSLLLAAMLRAKGVPARTRCGFATYFEAGRFVDHWVCEYRDGPPGRWVMVDPQLDRLQRERLGIDFDPLVVPADRFLTAGAAWAACRSGAADPRRFGILDMHGWWFVAGNLVRDLAALNDMPMLPWDVWGAMPEPDEPIDAERLALFDELARLTTDPDAAAAPLRRLYAEDGRLHVPAAVHNALLGRPEIV